jgi:hypothetical protein
MGTDRANRGSSALPWIALGFAFSPVWVQLIRELPTIPFGASILLAPALLLRAALAEPARPRARHRGLGLLLVGVGLLLELIGAAGGSWSIARFGIPAGVLGLALWAGSPSPRVAALSLWAVPIPTFFFVQTTPWAESAYAGLAAGLLDGLGFQVRASGPVVRGDHGILRLDDPHSGLHLASLLAQLAWFAALREGRSLRWALGRMAIAAVVALPLQALAVLGAVLLLLAGGPKLGSLWLYHGLWAVVAVSGVAWIEWRTRGWSADR